MRYTPTAIALHWLTALLVLVALPLGLSMTGLTLSPTKLRLYSYHKWLGVTVLALTAIRLWWRHRHPPPALPAHVPAWQKEAAATLHRALYAFLFLIPLSGWLMSSAKGVQTVYLGVLPLPDLLAKDETLGALLAIIHASLCYVFAAILAGHVGAALKHHFFDRDDILRRMLPRGRALAQSSTRENE